MMLMLSGMLTAQTVDNPPFKARSGSIGNITRIERTPDGTRVYIHAIFRPHWWIKEEGDSYLEDAATGKKYQFKSAEGIELNKEVYMPDSGEMDYVLVFEALPEETQVIHLLSPSDTEGNTYDISLVPSSGKNVSPLAAIKGNWFKADDLNTWEYGIYDSVTIMDNRIFTNEISCIPGKGELQRQSLPTQVSSSSSTQTPPVCKGTSTAMTAGWDLTPVSSIYPTISPARTTRL